MFLFSQEDVEEELFRSGAQENFGFGDFLQNSLVLPGPPPCSSPAGRAAWAPGDSEHPALGTGQLQMLW